jgi:competence protein ComEC
LRQYLRARGVNRLDGLLLTHGDAAHIGGASGVLLDFQPRQLIDTIAPNRSRIHRVFVDSLTKEKRARTLCQAGNQFSLSRDVTARVLFPPASSKGDRADDLALVIQLVVSGKPCVLLMSDSGAATEEYLLRNYSDLQSDILIKGQHHSGVSGSDVFLDRVHPRAIVATSRDFPESERIKPEWADGVRARGIKLFRQDKTGAVELRIFSDRWEATNYLTSETFRSPRR